MYASARNSLWVTRKLKPLRNAFLSASGWGRGLAMLSYRPMRRYLVAQAFAGLDSLESTKRI